MDDLVVVGSAQIVVILGVCMSCSLYIQIIADWVFSLSTCIWDDNSLCETNCNTIFLALLHIVIQFIHLLT